MNKLAIQVQYDENFEEVIKSVRRAGYRYVSVGFGSSKCFYYTDWEKKLGEIEKILAKNTIECIQTHLPCYDLRISAENIDEELDRVILRCVEASGKLGASWCAYHARTALNDNCSARKSMEYAKIALEPIIEKASIHKTGIAIENLPVFPNLHHVHFFTSDYDDLCELHDYFDCEEVGICWDFGHAHLMNFNEAKAIRMVGDRIKATHIHNNSQKDDDHLLPSQGTIDWINIMKEFKQFYQQALTLEINYQNIKFLDSFMVHSYDCLMYLKSLMADDRNERVRI